MDGSLSLSFEEHLPLNFIWFVLALRKLPWIKTAIVEDEHEACAMNALQLDNVEKIKIFMELMELKKSIRFLLCSWTKCIPLINGIFGRKEKRKKYVYVIKDVEKSSNEWEGKVSAFKKRVEGMADQVKMNLGKLNKRIDVIAGLAKKGAIGESSDSSSGEDSDGESQAKSKSKSNSKSGRNSSFYQDSRNSSERAGFRPKPQFREAKGKKIKEMNEEEENED